MKRLNRYYRYFCRSIVALICLFTMAFTIHGLFEYEDARMVAFGLFALYGSVIGSMIVAERAFRD